MNAKTRFAVSTLASVALALGMFLLVLLISHQNNTKWDLTKGQRHSLSEQSLQVVRELKAPVEAIGFLAESDEGGRHQTETLLDNYRRASNNKFSFRIVDPLKDPKTARDLDVTSPGPIVFKSGARTQRATVAQEQDITNALLKLSESTQKKLYLITGHGERKSDNEPGSIASFRKSMAEEGFESSELNLLSQKTVPKDAALIVLAGPTKGMLPAEQAELQRYLRSGGRMLFLMTAEAANQYDWLLKDYGITSPDEAVMGVSISGSEPVFAAPARYAPEHPITRGFNLNTLFGPFARPVVAAKVAPPGAAVVWLMETSPQMLVVPMDKVKSGQPVAPTPGARTLAVAGSYPAPAAAPAATPAAQPSPAAPPAPGPSTKLVVVGDVGFVSNQLHGLLGNRDLVLNMLNWLADSENRITIRPKNEATQPLVLSQTQSSQMKVLLILAIPLAVLLVGFLTAFRRRG